MAKLILILFFTIFSNLAAPTTLAAPEIFAQAVQKSQSGDCQAAIELFLQLPASVDNNLNIASCYFATEDYLSALLFIKKAEKMAGPMARITILKALKQVKAALGQPLPEPQSWRQKIDYAVHLLWFLLRGINVLWLELLLLGFWILLLLAFKAGRKWLAATCGVFSFLPLALLLFLSNLPQQAIVFAPQIELYSGPGAEFLVIANLSQANIVNMVAASPKDGFFRIKKGSFAGWVKQEAIRLI